MNEAEKHPEARVVVDDLLAFNTGSTNTKDDVIEELIHASQSTHEAARVLDDILNKNANTGEKKTANKTRNRIEEPETLIEEIMKDKDASPEEKNKLISDIVARASVSFEEDDTLSTLMEEARENPLAAQILHEMLSGTNQ